MSAQDDRQWLRTLADMVRTRLGSRPHNVGLTPTRTVELGRSGLNGWFTTLARLSGGGGTDLFIDYSADLPSRRLWYGFAATSEDRILHIANAGTAVTALKPIKGAKERAVGQSDFGKPYFDQFPHREYYYGIYSREPSDSSIPPSSRLAGTIADFFRSVAAAVPAPWAAPRDPDDGDADGPGRMSPAARVQQSIHARRGQAQFRKRLLTRFSGTCCVSGSTVRYLLEAAHIELHDKADDHRPSNGLLLRSDLHTLFDLGLIAIEPRTRRVRVSPDLRGTEYQKHDRQALRAPRRVIQSLNPGGLEQRWLTRRWVTVIGAV